MSESLYRKLVTARNSKAIVVTNPTAIKAFMLKFVELIHIIDKLASDPSALPKTSTTTSSVASLRQQADLCMQILQLFNTGCLFMDEVDLILHPLKSELNYPIGRKEALDMSQNKLAKGLRWELPFILMDVILHATPDSNQDIQLPSSPSGAGIDITAGNAGGVKTSKYPLQALMDSRDVEIMVQKLKMAIQDGAKNHRVQLVPHLVLLDRRFYHERVMPLLAQYTVIWLSLLKKTGIKDEQTYRYLTTPHLAGGSAKERVTTLLGINPDFLDDEFMKLLNLAHDLLHSIFPFVLGKINRVSFGLLSPHEIETAYKNDPKMPQSRTMTAIPFVGKDVPSQRSEFAHPDIVISLTVLAFRYEGLRRPDFLKLMTKVQEDLWDEDGPYHKRPAARRFAEWVHSSGGRVRGWLREERRQRQLEQHRKKMMQAETTEKKQVSAQMDLLSLMDFDDNQAAALEAAPTPVKPNPAEVFISIYIYIHTYIYSCHDADACID